MKPKQQKRNKYFWPDLDIWTGAGPSRRLRKAYAQLELVEREMEAVRGSNPAPDHAPTACRIINRQLRELGLEHGRILKRIGKLDGEDAVVTPRAWRMRWLGM